MAILSRTAIRDSITKPAKSRKWKKIARNREQLRGRRGEEEKEENGEEEKIGG